MYPSSSSSSSHGSIGTSTGGGLTRYGSAPGSLLTNAVDSVIGSNRDFSALRSQTQMGPSYFHTSESACKSSDNTDAPRDTASGLQRSYGFDDISAGEFNAASLKQTTGNGGAGESYSSPLVRHSSSPAGFLHHLASTNTAPDNGFSVSRGIGTYHSKGASDSSGCGISRLNSQLSFTRQDSFSQIVKECENMVDGISSENGQRKAAHSYASASFSMGSWDDTNSIVFSDPPSKRAKNINIDLVDGLNAIESQIQFGIPATALEMASVEKLLQIPQDSVPCKVRAKRGCATHPRSIAERERRTRISGRLKKLQDLVPNMDKQTSYADMLDLAVQHIKSLQDEIEKLNEDLDGCTCGCKQTN